VLSAQHTKEEKMPAPHVVYWATFGENVTQLIISTDQGAAEVVATIVRDTNVRTAWWAYLTDDGDVPGELIVREPQTLTDAQVTIEETLRVKQRTDAAAALFAAAHEG